MYDAYAEYQRLMERYWCVRYIAQEGIEETHATVIREELARIEGLPLVCRVVGLPPSPPGERVKVHFGEIDPWEATVFCRYAGK